MPRQKPIRPSKRQIYPILTWGIIVLAIVVFIGTPIWQSVPLWSNELFRLSFLGNWTATMLGTLVGIPVALALSRWQQSEQDRIQEERLEKERDERELFILTTIRDELQFNKDTLLKMIEDQAIEPGVYPIAGMKNVNWEVFSNTGELRWITDLRILHHLSEAYYHIKALINLESQFLRPEFDISPVRHVVDRSRVQGSTRILQHVHTERPEALRHVEDAIKIIQEKIGNDIVHSVSTSGLTKTFEP